jgi:hypothetical protein
MQDYQAIKEQLEQRYTRLQERVQKITSDIQHKDEPVNPDFSEQAV